MKKLKNMKIVRLETDHLKILEAYLEKLEDEGGDAKEIAIVKEAIALQKRYKQWGV